MQNRRTSRSRHGATDEGNRRWMIVQQMKAKDDGTSVEQTKINMVECQYFEIKMREISDFRRFFPFLQGSSLTKSLDSRLEMRESHAQCERVGNYG